MSIDSSCRSKSDSRQSARGAWKTLAKICFMVLTGLGVGLIYRSLPDQGKSQASQGHAKVAGADVTGMTAAPSEPIFPQELNTNGENVRGDFPLTAGDR